MKAKAYSLEELKSLAKLMKRNLSLVSSNVLPREDLENVEDKLRGVTHGYIVQSKINKLFLLLKKSERKRTLGTKEKTPSNDVNLETMAQTSFFEVFGSVAFSILKGSSSEVPNFYLVSSAFDEDKIGNAMKAAADVLKIYVASEIIGDKEEINQDQSDIQRLLSDRFVTTDGAIKDRREAIIKDLCENSLIMMILLNFDIKPDNYYYPSDHNVAIPIDFGDLAYRGISPDIAADMDSVLRPSGDSYSPRHVRSDFATFETYRGVQGFYRNNLSVEHLTSLNQKIKLGGKDLERKLWDAAYLFCFGDDDVKRNFANNIIARLRNFEIIADAAQQSVKPLLELETKSKPKKGVKDSKEKETKKTELSDKQFRNILSKFAGFRESQKDNPLLKIVKESFELVSQSQLRIQEFLSENKPESFDVEKRAIFDGMVQTLVQNCGIVRAKFEAQEKAIGEKYNDSDYVTGRNGVTNRTLGSLFSEMSQVFDAVALTYENLTDASSKASSRHSSFGSEEDGGFSFAAEAQASKKEDLSVRVSNKVDQSIKFTRDKEKRVTEQVYELLSHLQAHDTLALVRDEYKDRSLEASPSVQVVVKKVEHFAGEVVQTM